MRFIQSIVFLLFTFPIFSQNITILDQDTQLPLAGVTLVNLNESKSVTSDEDGLVDISIFTNTESIIVQHLGHEAKTTTKASIIGSNNTLYLQKIERELGEVILSVAKFQQNPKDLAQQVATVTPEQIGFTNPQTAADLLSHTGEVFVQKSQLGGGSPMIRGFSTNRLLITVDGVRMNTAIFRAGNLQNVINVDPFSLERTEVILGPGSVAYGSDAIGGVMNFYTKKPRFSFEDGIAVSGSADVRYASANFEKTGHFDINIGNKKWAFLTSASYSDYDDLRMGSNGPDDYIRTAYVEQQNGEDVEVANDDENVQTPTGFDIVHLTQKVRYMPNEIWDFNLGLTYSTTSNYSRYDRLIRKRSGHLRTAEWYYGPQRWFLSNFNVDKKGSGPYYDEAKLTVAYQFFEESRHDRDFGNPTLYETDEKVDAYSAELDFSKEIGTHQIFYGLEYVYNHVGSSGQKTNKDTGITEADASRYPDNSKWQSMAAYASGKFTLSEKLNLISGLRYNQVLLDATFDDRFYDFPFEEADISSGNLTGSLGLNWQTSEVLGWKVNLSTAFRAPNIDDVGKIFDSEPGSVVVPNPDLKAEYAYNGEIGLLLNFNEKVQFDLAGYYTHLDNAMVRRDFNLNGETTIDYQGEPSNVQAIQNLAQAKVYGLEAGMRVAITQHLEFDGQLNLIDGSQEEDDGSDAPLRHAAPTFGNAHIIWERNKFKLDAYTEFNGQFDYDELSISEQGKTYMYALDADGNPYSPSWQTLNLVSQYQISEAVQATAALENITDERYRTYSSGISAPGRNLILAVKYLF